jgi:hypothetical protein
MTLSLKNIACATTFIMSILLAPLQASFQEIVINEVDAIQSGGVQFVELFGTPNSDLDGYSLALVKANFLGGGLYEAQIYEAISLEGLFFSPDGFIVFELPLNTTIAAVALYEMDVSGLIIGEGPPADDIVDAIVYGNTSPGAPQAAILLQALMPLSSGLIYEGAEGNSLGHSISRFPDGGSAFDVDSYVLQASTMGVTNILACDGGYLEITNLANDTLCTDQGPAIATFNHFSDAPYALLTLLIVDPLTDEILSSANGSAINFQDLGDGDFDVIAVSHDLPLVPSTIVAGELFTEVSGEGCVSASAAPFSIHAITCESPACDGGTMLDASGSPTVLVCLAAEETFVPFGYYSEAVEDDFLFAICSADDIILATTTLPFYDFTDLGADFYRVWGVSTQGEIDPTSVEIGANVQGVMAAECDSIGASPLEVTILQCGDAGLCDDLIISEYIEGDSHNKAIEIHNPSPLMIELSGYSVEVYNNGATEPTQSLQLEGQLLPGGVFVIGNSQSEPALQNLATVMSQVTWYNGNDAIVLRKNGEAIDIMGAIGVDPGEPWTVTSGGSMAEFTLVRKPNVGSGTTDWAEGMTQWDTYPQDTFDFLGSHSATCGGIGIMQIGFDAPELYVSEGGGVQVSISPLYPLEDATMQVSVVGGDAVIGSDFPDVFPLEFDFEMGLLNAQTFTFTAINDEEPELQEDVVLALSVVFGEVELGIDTLVVHILPSDLDYPVYEINQVRGTNPQGLLDSIGTACELRGIVHGWNDYPTGLQFTLIDETNGINAFSPVSDFGYDVQEGDSVRVRGVIDQYLGLAQIRLDTLIYEGSGFDSEVPNLVFEMDEETESRIVTLKCVELVDPDEWTNTTPGFDVRLSFGAQEIVMRVDANTDLFSEPVPLGVFGVTGIGGQRDYSPPLVDGYTITPRGQSDLTAPVSAEFAVATPWDGVVGPVLLANLSTGASGYLWDMGDDTSYQVELPEHYYTSDGTFTITLTAFSEDGNCSDQFSQDIVSTWVKVEELEEHSFRAFPNPTSATVRLQLEGNLTTTHWKLFNSTGHLVMEERFSPRGEFTVDMTNLSPGIYAISIGEGQGSARLIKR